MVMGRSYQMGRQLGRMSQDSSMRMTNRAEVGFGMVGMFMLAMFILIMIGVFI